VLTRYIHPNITEADESRGPAISRNYETRRDASATPYYLTLRNGPIIKLLKCATLKVLRSRPGADEVLSCVCDPHFLTALPRLRRFIIPTGLQGHVPISSTTGPVSPHEGLAYHDESKNELESGGLKVNIRPAHRGRVSDRRPRITTVWFSGDSLPRHLALGSGA